MNPLVSVIIPIYKTEQYLPGCVKSVLEQTYQNLEILLVEDGSPDRCPEICDTFARQDPRIRVIHKQNGGLSDARNAGIDSASGEYLTFLDSDDLIGKHTIETMVFLAGKESADIVKIRSERISRIADCVETEGGYSTETSVSMLRRIYRDPPQIISACGKLFKKELFSDIRFPVGKYYEDEFTTPKLYAAADRIVVSEALRYFYMQWENESIMRSALLPKKVRDAVEMSEDRCAFFKKFGNRSLVNASVRDLYYRLVKYEQAESAINDAELSAEIKRKLDELTRTHRAMVFQIRCKQRLYNIKQMIIGGKHE